MKRALLVLLAGAAVPASALAQNAGAISLPTGFTSIDIAQCTGQQNAIVGNDTLTIGLSWNVATTAGTTFAAAGTFALYASTQQPGAGQGNVTSCTQNSSGGSITANKVPNTDGVSDITASANPMTQTFSLQAIASAAGAACTGSSTSTVYLCVQWNSGSSATAGWANGQLTLDPTAPAAPTAVSYTPGDGMLHLAAAVDATATSCKANATSTADSSPHWSSQAACDSLTIDGLENNQEYMVVVYAINAANNPGPASAAVPATPFPTSDFWNQYQSSHGQDQGGCSTSGAAGGILGGLSLLALRRRKP